MKIRAFVAEKYGIHDQLSAEFPAGPSDLHLIVGPNESGKSTLRTAIEDFLFGVPRNSRQAQIFGGPSMKLSATLDLNGATLDLVRLKKQKDTLLDGKGMVLTRDPLGEYVGQHSRADFQRDFCMDLDRLKGGGKALVADKANASRTMFSAATGIGGIKQLATQIDQEADQLFSGTASASRQYYRARKDFQDAQKRVKDAVVRRKDWAARDKAASDARQRTRLADEAHRAATADVARFKRLSQAAPIAAQLAAAQRKRDEMGPLPPIPAALIGQFPAMSAQLRRAEVEIKSGQQQLAQLQERHASLQFDPQLLLQAEEIRALTAEGGRIRDHARDIVARGAAAERDATAALKLARDLGWRAQHVDALGAMVPAALDVAELRAVAAALERAKLTLTQAAEQARICQDKLEEAKRESGAGADAEELPAELLEACRDAKSHGDVGQRLAQLGKQVSEAETQVRVGLETLAPWAGDLHAFCVLKPLPEATAQAADRAHEKLRDAIARIGAELNALPIDRLEAALAAPKRGEHIPSRDEVMAARRERETRWTEVKENPGNPLLVAPFEEAVAAADELADVRFDRAEQARAIDERQRQLVETRATQARLLEERTNREGELDAALREWRNQLSGAGLPAAFNPHEYTEWLARYRAIQPQVAGLARAQEERDREIQRVEGVTSRVRAALTGLKAAGSRPHEASLGELLARVEACEQALLAQRAQANAAAKGLQRATSDTAATARKATEAERVLRDAESAWEKALGRVSLRSGTSTEAAMAVVDKIPAITSHLEAHREASSRVADMQRDLAHYRGLVGRVAEQAGLADPGAAPELLALSLQAQLDAALTKQVQAKELLDQIGDRRASLEQAMRRLDEAKSVIDPLLAATSATDLDALAVLLDRVEAAQQAERVISQFEAQLQVLAGLSSVDALLEELGTLSPDELSVRAADAEAHERKTESDWREAMEEVARTTSELAAVKGSDEAAQAEADRQIAITAMSDAIEQYLPLRTMKVLLDWSIKRYRELHKDPILNRAGEIFSALTLGEYSAIHLSDDEKDEELVAIHPSGTTVQMQDLSVGTGDQLFLSLRIASLELQIQAGLPPLPFVADDLFVNFDDARAAAGFRVLKDLSKLTQVIYITHHDHLMPIFRGLCGSEASIVEMRRLASHAPEQR